MNRIQQLFQRKNKNVLSVFCTAGYPQLNSLPGILQELQKNGVDLVEIGMPFSDPTADGPTIQYSNNIAIKNGMTLEVLFDQLKNIRNQIHIPLVLMGYINPALQFGFEQFLQKARECGIDGIIIPDLPMYEYETMYASLFHKYNIENIFLITPQTTTERVRKIDSLSNSFIYTVSTHSITGSNIDFSDTQKKYFERIQAMGLKNPLIAGFGIRDKYTFDFACSFLNGAIIGSAFVKSIENSKDLKNDIRAFVHSIIK